MNDSPTRHTLPWLDAIMRRLLAPDGCPWDREQTLESLKQYLIEECYEVIDAIDNNDRAAHTEELGDLLLQIVFQAQLAQITLSEVIASIGEKLIRRHPHVFGDATAADANEVLDNWERIKREEKGAAPGQDTPSALDGVPRAMPPLFRAHKLIGRARRAGFVWPDSAGARNKLDEELAEFDAALSAGDNDEAQRELGDVLLAVVGLARDRGLDVHLALDQANRRFSERFAKMESLLGTERPFSEHSADELLAAWQRAKDAESASS
ncbi:MAG: nucleoside triphosphate pyrophosphohydrolase [Deltaproteobacteria bacterium]|nr:nucleoside triphosphate pyrophosphohydrolase [Deltaproteobacteria bacterium]